jgi:hypothetical protein
VSHVSSIVRPPMLTSPPPQPSSTAVVAPQDTRDLSATSPLSHTKPGAHYLTQKTYIANQNNICSKPAQEDIADGFVSRTPGSYRACRPQFHCHVGQTNLTLLIVPRIQHGDIFKYFSRICCFVSYIILLSNLSPFLQT